MILYTAANVPVFGFVQGFQIECFDFDKESLVSHGKVRFPNFSINIFKVIISVCLSVLFIVCMYVIPYLMNPWTDFYRELS